MTGDYELKRIWRCSECEYESENYSDFIFEIVNKCVLLKCPNCEAELS